MIENLPENIDLNNNEFQEAWKLIQHTSSSVFLTGKAGTGKSTFLKYICANTKKKHVVLAPTGIAAVNVGGCTMHSFFKMPLKPLLPDDPEFSPHKIRHTLRYTRDKVKLLKSLDRIIIDEMSMVRADMIDFMDRVLRIYSGNMREPFGGKQMLFVGDVFQLEPVVTTDMRDILRRYYDNFFFFNAFAFKQVALVPIELRKVYRQNEQTFISVLDRVRENQPTAIDLQLLHNRCNPNYKPNPDSFVMTLATRRDTVDNINESALAAIDSEEFVFNGEIDGVFPEQSLPTSLRLAVKKNAQVMFIRNDMEHRWVNGTLGRISYVDSEIMRVTLEDGEEYDVEPTQWENIQYKYDEEHKAVTEEVLGSFKQYPVKPAWALTVHKSQGLTFNNVVIDFVGGAFTGGQTYVALSRCTSLEGICLLNPLQRRDVMVNPTIVEFSRTFNNEALIQDAIREAQAGDLYRQAIKAFDEGKMDVCVEKYAQAAAIRSYVDNPLMRRFAVHKLNSIAKLHQKIRTLEDVVDAQNNILRSLADEYAQMGCEALKMDGMAHEQGVAYGNNPDSIATKSAMANFNKALRICPDCLPAMLGKARLLFALEMTNEALHEVLKTIDAHNSCFDAHLLHGEILEAKRSFPEAIKAYKRAAKHDKYNPIPHDRLANILDDLGFDDLADEHREKARKLRSKPRKSQ